MVFALFWLTVGLLIGAFVWTPLAIRENDRRWQERVRFINQIRRERQGR